MEKHNYIVLSEMVSVLISYIEIDNYKVNGGLHSFSRNGTIRTC
jgi:hypothetical protein